MEEQPDSARPPGRPVPSTPPPPFGAYVAVTLVAFGIVLPDHLATALGLALLVGTGIAVVAQRLDRDSPGAASAGARASSSLAGWVIGAVLAGLGVLSADLRGVYLGAVVVGFTSVTSWYRRHTGAATGAGAGDRGTWLR